MEKMLGLMQESNVNLALIWRPFTPVYSPSRLEGVTPLLYVAQIRQSSILKILLQYGLLERERCPMHILLTILFYPPSPHILDELYYRNIIDDTKDCIALCARVLTRISVSDVETQIDFGRDPLIADWKDYIPVTRYRDPCELSHLCRATIRWCLLGRINLPKGIRELPLPPALQRFLNLES
ncbi:ASB17 protein, partial [Amia calva]|nr:ASB17 protein [Amia calva]